MRLAPVALRFRHDRPRLLAAAADQSRTTHGAEEAVDACRAFGELLADAIAGSPFSDVMAPRRFTGADTQSLRSASAAAGEDGHGIRSAPAGTSFTRSKIHGAAIWSVARTGDFRGAVLLEPTWPTTPYGSSSDGAARRRPLRPERHPRPLAGSYALPGRIDSWQRRGGCFRNPLPTGRSWVGSRSTALDPVANTDAKLLILWPISKGPSFGTGRGARPCPRGLRWWDHHLFPFRRRCCTARSKSLTSPVPVAESPGAVRIGHPERSILVEYLAPNSVFNSLPRQRSARISGPMIAL